MVVAPILTVFCILFWMLGCCIGSSRVTPMMNPAAGVSGVTISDVVINPGNEVCTIKNRTFSDVVSLHKLRLRSDLKLMTPNYF